MEKKTQFLLKDYMKIICIQFYTLKNMMKTYKIKIIELQNPWGRNEQEDAEQFALNLDEKYKYIEDNLKKVF